MSVNFGAPRHLNIRPVSDWQTRIFPHLLLTRGWKPGANSRYVAAVVIGAASDTKATTSNLSIERSRFGAVHISRLASGEILAAAVLCLWDDVLLAGTELSRRRRGVEMQGSG